MRWIVRRRLLALKLFARSLPRTHAECPGRRIARRERSHDVVVYLSFTHVFAAVPFVIVLAPLVILAHTANGIRRVARGIYRKCHV